MRSSRRRQISTRSFTVMALGMALLLACVVSWWASGSPDGLEYVAGQTGIVTSHQGIVDEGPLAGYRTAGVQDERWSSLIAGFAGCTVTFVAAWLLGRGVRGRRPSPRDR